LSDPEDDLVIRYRESGLQKDYEALVQRWLPSIRRFLRLQLGSDQDACEDVQQEVLVALVPSLAGFNGRSQFSTFLFRLVRNKAIDHQRRQTRYRRVHQPLEDEQTLTAGSQDPLESFVQKESAERLFALILQLPLPDRELLYFREIEELGEKEVSVLTGKPVGTLKSRLHRIKKKLFLQMEEGGSS
jgi:RNA polymerase sigma-70 factor (ECF subfamily)